MFETQIGTSWVCARMGARVRPRGVGAWVRAVVWVATVRLFQVGRDMITSDAIMG